MGSQTGCRADPSKLLLLNECGENPALLRVEKDNTAMKRSKTQRGFTLIEIMIVVAIIALLAAIAVPGFLRARKRSQATRVLNDLRSIDSAVDQYALENHKIDGETVSDADWKAYLKHGTKLYDTGQDVFGNDYGPQLVGQTPKVPLNTKDALADVTDDAFWSPFQ
jgi:prepilin-type N-terminal cleavage/methylation domain-containing protein